MRIFGLHEPEDENPVDLKTKLVNSVLKIARPDYEWNDDAITETYRVGGRNQHGQRLVIAKFKSPNEKSVLYTGRDNLRKKGVRISEELTTRERDILNNLREKGRTGYFQKGKLHIRSETSNLTNRPAGGRHIVNGTRRTQSAQNISHQIKQNTK